MTEKCRGTKNKEIEIKNKYTAPVVTTYGLANDLIKHEGGTGSLDCFYTSMGNPNSPGDDVSCSG